jgi:hypothetical protein
MPFGERAVTTLRFFSLGYNAWAFAFSRHDKPQYTDVTGGNVTHVAMQEICTYPLFGL